MIVIVTPQKVSSVRLPLQGRVAIPPQSRVVDTRTWAGITWLKDDDYSLAPCNFAEKIWDPENEENRHPRLQALLERAVQPETNRLWRTVCRWLKEIEVPIITSATTANVEAANPG